MPSFVRSLVFVFALGLLGRSALADDFSVAPLKELPDGPHADIAKALATPGHKVTGPDGPLCSVWFVKSPALKEGFSPTLSVKHPFAPGAFLGLLRVEEGTEFTDFREQVLKPGLYALRYAHQPQDGNHIGTSDLADFLLAVPAKAEESPETAEALDDVVALATEAAGSTHPAILALRPAESGTPGEAKLVHDAGDELWLLETAVGTEKPHPLRLVVVGFAFE